MPRSKTATDCDVFAVISLAISRPVQPPPMIATSTGLRLVMRVHTAISRGSQQAKPDEFLGHAVDILAAALFPNSCGHHHDRHHRPLHAINNPVALPHGAHAAITREVVVKRFPAQFRIRFQAINDAAQFLTNAPIRDRPEHRARSRRDNQLVRQRPSSFLTCSQGMPLPSSISFTPCRNAAINSGSDMISMVSTTDSYKSHDNTASTGLPCRVIFTAPISGCFSSASASLGSCLRASAIAIGARPI